MFINTWRMPWKKLEGKQCTVAVTADLISNPLHHRTYHLQVIDPIMDAICICCMRAQVFRRCFRNFFCDGPHAV